MDRLTFVFSSLFIFSVTNTFGFVIKANNPTEVVKNGLMLLPMIKIFALSIPWHFWSFLLFFLFRIYHSMLKLVLRKKFCKRSQIESATVSLKYSNTQTPNVYMWFFTPFKLAGKRCAHAGY